MESAGTNYRLFKRNTGKRRVYYARFFGGDGKLTKTLSTGETNRYQADNWCREHIHEAQERYRQEADNRNQITVSCLSVGFWEYSGAYAQGRILRENSISYGHLEISAGYTKNHIIPWVPNETELL